MFEGSNEAIPTLPGVVIALVRKLPSVEGSGWGLVPQTIRHTDNSSRGQHLIVHHPGKPRDSPASLSGRLDWRGTGVIRDQ